MNIKFPKPLKIFSVITDSIAGILLMAIIFLTVGDVLARNLFSTSILGTVDITTLLLVGVAFLGLASSEVFGRHVTVTLVEEHVDYRARFVFSVIRLITFCFIAVTMTWYLLDTVISAFSRQETTIAILALPTWPAKAVILVSFVVFFIAAIFREVQEAKGFYQLMRNPELEEEELDVTEAPGDSDDEVSTEEALR